MSHGQDLVWLKSCTDIVPQESMHYYHEDIMLDYLTTKDR